MNSSENVILAHMNKNEVDQLARAQGGIELNKELDIPEFNNLSKILKNDEIRNLINYGWKRFKSKPNTKKNQYLEEMDSAADQEFGDESQFGIIPQGEEAEQLDMDGMHGDNELVALSPELFDFFKDKVKHVSQNPNDGLPQFFTGQEFLSFLGSAMPFISAGSSIYGLWNEEDDKIASHQKHNAMLQDYERKREEAHKIDEKRYSRDFNLLTGKRNRSHPDLRENASIRNHINKMFSTKKENLTTPKKEDDDGFWGFLKKVGGAALSAAPFLMLKDGGVVEEIRKLKPIKKSTYLEGNEKGQADNIHVDTANGSYVIDAATVSSLGDGCSEAGAKVINKFLKSLDNSFDKAISIVNKKHVPCALSAGEFVVNPTHVLKIGNGNIKHGHKILKDAIIEIRKHKGAPINGIPPKAYDLETYIKKVI